MLKKIWNLILFLTHGAEYAKAILVGYVQNRCTSSGP
jgi:hypothetical protein